MKAAVCREHGKPLVIETLKLDPPQAGEVKVQIAACAICHSDIIFMDGGWGGEVPAVYGHEAAGVIDCSRSSPRLRSSPNGQHLATTRFRCLGSMGLSTSTMGAGGGINCGGGIGDLHRFKPAV